MYTHQTVLKCKSSTNGCLECDVVFVSEGVKLSLVRSLFLFETQSNAFFHSVVAYSTFIITKTKCPGKFKSIIGLRQREEGERVRGSSFCGAVRGITLRRDGCTRL